MWFQRRTDAWPQLETCLRSLSSPAASEVQQDLFFRFVIEAPLVVADVDVAEVVSTLQTALQTPKSAKLLVMTVKAAVAILISDDRAEKMDALVPSIMDVSLGLSISLAHVYRAEVTFLSTWSSTDLPKAWYEGAQRNAGKVPLCVPRHLRQYLLRAAAVAVPIPIPAFRHVPSPSKRFKLSSRRSRH